MAKEKFKEKLKVLHIASELTPIAKAGGLGDVVGQLPKAIAQEYHIEIKIIIPKYQCIDTDYYKAERIIKDSKILMPNGCWQKMSFWKVFVPGTIIPVYLVDCPKYFQGKEVYDNKVGNLGESFPYFYLSWIALQFLKIIDWQPDVIHDHDGMTGLVSKWLRIKLTNDFYKTISSVLSIHNLKYQPILKQDQVKYVGLKRADFGKVKKILKSKDFNIMAEGIDNADMINTVSPTYAREVLTKKYGAGLHKLLKLHKHNFAGILNGIDYSDFDPRTNPDTPVKYWINTLDKKVENKMILQKKFGLTQSADLPLICVVSRLTPQKGLDLVEDVLKDLVDMGAQFVILGAGSEKIEKIFIKAEKENPKSIEAEMEFDANLAQTIYAGADMLSQIIAMRFGTLPIVRKTGGLADTVRDGYTGFVFKHYDKNAFLWAIQRAVDMYYNQKDYWRKMQIRAMKKDFSWKASAKKYIWLYKKAIRNHKKYLEENGS